MKMKRLILLLLLGALLITMSCTNKPAQCPLCERDIHAHMQVSVTRSRLPLKTCCMSCALTFQAQNKDVQIVKVTDFNTNAQLDPQSAFYVVDSDISPCTQDPKAHKMIRDEHSVLFACYDRCSPGILAFSSKDDAEKFQKEQGGHLAVFAELKKWVPAAGEHSHD